MSYRIIFRSAAQEEALAAADYISQQTSVEQANRWLDGLEELLASLGDMPNRFPHARENNIFLHIELRQAVYHSHRLIFTVRDDEVHVLHVRHTAQQNLEEL